MRSKIMVQQRGFASTSSDLQTYSADTKDVSITWLANLTADRLRHFVTERQTNFELDADSDTLFIVRRNEVEDLEDEYLAPISANFEIRLMATIDTLQRLERIDLYRNFASVPASRVVAGLMYESLAHARLQEGIELKLKPIIKWGKLRTHFHWKIEGVEQTGNSVTFPANAAIIYEGTLASIEPNHLYVPKARNQVGLDSFFKLDQTLYIFQLTVVNEHDIKEGMKSTLSELLNMLPPETNWKFVFITPGGELYVKAKATPKVEGFLDGLELYTADLEFK